MSTPSLYELLGVPETATRQEIHRAYLRLARREHPDTGGSDAAMGALNRAWAVLGDDRRRRAYDRDRAWGTASPIDVDEEAADRVDLTDTEHAADRDDIDDDRPLTSPLHRLSILAVVPVATFLASVAAFVLGVVFEGRHLLGLALALFLVACALMVAVPFVQMTRSRRSSGGR
ncbi:MAG: J domain-containing protein [Acidimicrobiales bacterium]